MRIQLKETNSAIFTEKNYPYPVFLDLSKQMTEGENVAFSILEQDETLYTTNDTGFVKIGENDKGNDVHAYLQETFLKIIKANRWRIKFRWTTKRLIKKLAKRLDDEVTQPSQVVPHDIQEVVPNEPLPEPAIINTKDRKRQFNLLSLLLTSLISSLVSICVCLFLFSMFQTELHPQIKGATPLTLSAGENFDVMKDVSTTSQHQPISVTGSVDITQAGYYFLTYQVGQTAVIRPVKVVNDKPRLKGIKDSVITKGDKLDIYEGISAEDKEDGQLTKEIQVSGLIDTSKAGTYYLTYSVSDSRHQSDQKTRMILVNESGKN